MVKIDPSTQKRTLIAEVPMDNPSAPSWVHDLPATENYIVVPDTPIVNDIMSVKVLLPFSTAACKRQTFNGLASQRVGMACRLH